MGCVLATGAVSYFVGAKFVLYFSCFVSGSFASKVTGILKPAVRPAYATLSTQGEARAPRQAGASRSPAAKALPRRGGTRGRRPTRTPGRHRQQYWVVYQRQALSPLGAKDAGRGPSSALPEGPRNAPTLPARRAHCLRASSVPRRKTCAGQHSAGRRGVPPPPGRRR